MIKILSVVLLPMLLSSISFAQVNFDGCYQLYAVGTMYPAFCLSGTTEEGINGSGARLTLFKTNTDSPLACAVSSSLKMTANSLTFIVGSSPELKMTVLSTKANGLEGIVTFRSTTLNFMQYDSATTQKLFNKVATETGCASLAPGEFARLQ